MPAGNRLGGAVLRVEQDGGGCSGQGGGDIQLETGQVEVADGGRVGRVERPAQVLAMVQGQAGEGGSFRSALLQAAQFTDG